MSGRKRLTAKSLQIIARSLALTPVETDQLALEVGGLAPLGGERPGASAADLAPRALSQESSILNWRTIAILEYLDTHHKDHSALAISRHFGISLEVVTAAIASLLSEGLIARDPKRRGRLVKTEASNHFASHLPHAALRSYHHELLQLGSRAINEVDPARRPIGSVAFAMDPNDLPEVQARWRAFRRNLEAFVGQGKKKSTVYVAVFECFPLSVAQESL